MIATQAELISWYLINGRELPWRNTKDPYLIWLSEIILQQTRVQQGLPYYLKFSKIYPTVQHLARANEEDVLNLWQGLGYYSRARNMLKTANEITKQLNGHFPQSHQGLLKLKGVGEYTAAAIASFSFDEAVAVVDGNVYRVLSRLFDIDIPIDSGGGKKVFQELAGAFLDKKQPAIFNQAIMEFGALHCTPKKPDCFQCVLSKSCISKARGTVNLRPVKQKKTKVTQRFFVFNVVLVDEQTIIQKRVKKDIWQGMYEFPMEEFDSKSQQSEYLEQNRKNILFQSEEITHILSHQRITAYFIFVKPTKERGFLSGTGIKVHRNQLYRYPVSVLTDNFLKKTNDLSFLLFDENVN